MQEMITKCQGAEKMCSLYNAGTVQRSSVSYVYFIFGNLPRLRLSTGSRLRFEGFLYIGSV